MHRAAAFLFILVVAASGCAIQSPVVTIVDGRKVGKLADLFVVDGNPLDDIRNTRNVRWVMRGGRHYDAARLLASVEGTLGPQGPSDENAWRPRRNR